MAHIDSFVFFFYASLTPTYPWQNLHGHSPSTPLPPLLLSLSWLNFHILGIFIFPPGKAGSMGVRFRSFRCKWPAWFWCLLMDITERRRGPHFQHFQNMNSSSSCFILLQIFTSRTITTLTWTKEWRVFESLFKCALGYVRRCPACMNIFFLFSHILFESWKVWDIRSL